MKLTKVEKQEVFNLLCWRLKDISAWDIEHNSTLKQLNSVFLKLRMDLKGY